MILRGSVDDSRKAGPAKEAALASACMFDKWSQEVLDCVGAIGVADTERHAEESTKCLAKLTTEQRDALDTKLTAWAGVYENETWVTAEDERLANLPPDIPCISIINQANVVSLLPAIGVVGEERDFVLQSRKLAVVAACEQWPREIRACVQDGGALTACRGKLDAPAEQALAGKLAAIDALMTRIVAAKKKPAATYDCKAVVASHYRDAAWVGKAEPVKNPKATRAELAKQAADRKAMIADSRRAMLDACTAEAWSSTVRVCELIEGGVPCSQGTGRSFVRWGFPAMGTMMRTGVPECDAYGVSVQALVLCNQFPQTTKDAIKQAFAQQVAVMKQSTDPSLARQMALSCKQGDDAVKQALSAVGCTP